MGSTLIQRVFNIEFDPNLVLMHSVFLSTYREISARMQALGDGRDIGVGFDPRIFDVLAILTRQLAERINKQEEMTDLLEQSSVVGYSTTGNGYYLTQAGRITY